ncbi:MAG: hypothetical protein OEZ33_11280 [Gammaproteobacteria bacterium]|nr:hypothetical protein [Gammaproteobacteria bacterium]
MTATQLDPHVENAIIDAQLVVDYLARTGLLKQDGALITELTKAKKTLADDNTPPDVTKLLEALSESVKDVSDDMSLVDIRSGYSPFSWCYKLIRPGASITSVVSKFMTGKVWFSKYLAVFFLILSFSFSFACIEWYRTSLTLLKDAQKLENFDTNTVIGEIVQGVKDDVIDINNKSRIGYLAYVNNTRKLSQAVNAAQELIAKISNENYSGKNPIYKLLYLSGPPIDKPTDNESLVSYNTTLFEKKNNIKLPKKTILKSAVPSQEKTNDENSDPVVNGDFADKQKSEQERLATMYAEQYAQQSENGHVFDEVDLPKNNCGSFKEKLKGTAGPTKALINNIYTNCIEVALSLDQKKRQINNAKAASQHLSNNTYRLTAWLIPLFVGLLGASVYLIYSNDTRNPHISIHRTFLRFLLGGIAGIIVAWFYPPAIVSARDLSVLDTNQFPFIFAFLAGFGTDTVFKLVSQKLNTLVKNKAGSEPGVA